MLASSALFVLQKSCKLKQRHLLAGGRPLVRATPQANAARPQRLIPETPPAKRTDIISFLNLFKISRGPQALWLMVRAAGARASVAAWGVVAALVHFAFLLLLLLSLFASFLIFS
ncbi:uncharacterized protein TM35_000201920 [Trypanosoma theileri]|uniref:Uncharacterized protein n=1 Tax=Trypanosoma theileri TaxID=67003 RepID=A0A1X0NTI0_9TRYP|nr:uncharacterized protein TM35_000201920 [Trypanosoma theileri]ORC87783.1 hypothetical protein TM35_000201920 [Trypanosoma theileri]